MRILSLVRGLFQGGRRVRQDRVCVSQPPAMFDLRDGPAPEEAVSNVKLGARTNDPGGRTDQATGVGELPGGGDGRSSCAPPPSRICERLSNWLIAESERPKMPEGASLLSAECPVESSYERGE